jgi:hypothetical protein
LLATLSANEGNMTKTVANRSFVNIEPRIERLASPSGNSKTINIPTTPKTIDEQMNIRVAIFCMVSVYHIKILLLTQKPISKPISFYLVAKWLSGRKIEI